jgi:tetratricopeptide (TPR) repeat protein
VYSHAGFYERAISFFERAIALDSANPSFLRNLGVAAQFAGDFDAAERAYREELKYAAKQRRPYAALVQLRKQSPEENFLPELEAQFAQETDIKARLQIGHAIAKTLEDLGQWPESLAWLQRAKEPMAKAVGDITGRAAALFAAAREAFARTPLGGGDPSAAPIFIVGMPRTGTTLTDRILTSLPGVASAGELGFIQRLASEMAMPLAEQPLSDARVMAASARLDVSELGRNYLELARERLPAGNTRFVDKMPINFLYAGLIHRALPNARIICLRRDPMDACLSNYRQIFSPDAAHYWYSFRLDWTAAYYAAFDAMIAHWREVLPSDRFTEVRYESMVADLEPEARRLVEFCGLPWDARCLDFHENSQPVATASSVQSRAPLYNTSVGRWRRYGEGIKPLEQALAARGF